MTTTPATEGNVGNEKKTYMCRRCKTASISRRSRGFLVRTLLFWLPVRKYFCYNCKRQFYVWR